MEGRTSHVLYHVKSASCLHITVFRVLLLCSPFNSEPVCLFTLVIELTEGNHLVFFFVLFWISCRMEDLIPILLHYVRSRQKPGGYVLWVAHNARCFDVPFIINELRRCSTEIPPNWLFVDTLPLARELMKSGGLFSLYFTWQTHTHKHTYLMFYV